MRSQNQVPNLSTHQPGREARLRAARLLSGGSDNYYIPPSQLLEMNDPFAGPIQGTRVILGSHMKSTQDTTTSDITVALPNVLSNTFAMQALSIDLPATGHAINQSNHILYFVEEPIVDGALFLFAAHIPMGNYTATDLSTIMAIAMTNATCLTVPGTVPVNTYSCAYEGTYTSSMRISADFSDLFSILSPTPVLANPIAQVSQLSSTLLRISTTNKRHGLAPGEIIDFLTVKTKEANFTLRNIQILKSDECDPSANFFTVHVAPPFVWPFAATSVSPVSSSLITKSMTQNIAPTIGYDVSVAVTPIPILHYALRSTVHTFVTATPHALVVGDQADIYIGGVKQYTMTITSSQSDFDFTSSTTMSLLLSDAPRANASIVTKHRIAPNKVDLTMMNRTVLVRCLLNGSIEVGSITSSQSSMSFLARVQLSSSPNSIQFVKESLHSMGVFELPHAIKKLAHVRLELYNENGMDLYDLHGINWSIALEFMCDSHGK